ncbi:hypothetical protein P9112_010133 [Eukaryota sp. TZLM1-RC]
MCNSYYIESFVEPLLRFLDINESVRDSEYGKRRADVVVPSFDDVMNVVDVVSVDVCKKNALRNAQSEVSPRIVQTKKISKSFERIETCSPCRLPNLPICYIVNGRR